MAACCERFVSKRMWNAAVTIAADNLSNDHLIAIEPTGLPLLCSDVYWMFYQLLKCIQGFPVVHIGNESC